MVKNKVLLSTCMVAVMFLSGFGTPLISSQNSHGGDETIEKEELTFFTYVENASTPLFGENLKAFVESSPSDAEYLPVLAGLCTIYDPNIYRLVTLLKIAEEERWEALKPQLTALLDSSHVRVRALARLIAAELPEYNKTPSKRFPSIEEAATARDDWEAFSIYRCAAKRGEVLTDEQFLACVDESCPTLAAAVLENRFHSVYRRKGEISEAERSGKTDFINTLLNRCLTLHRGDDPRLVIPPIYVVIHFGKTDYIKEYVFLVDSAFPELRKLAYEGLLRYADTSLYRYFIKGLEDKDMNVRLLSIRGLGAIRDSRAIGPLAKILRDESELGRVRAAAANALGEIGDRRIVNIFRSFLLAPKVRGDISARAAAARALGQLKEKTAVDALIANIDTETESELNYECIVALGKIRSTTGFKRLFPIVEEGWDLWYEKNFLTFYDNAYASLWALFPHRSRTVSSFCRNIFDEGTTAATGKSEFNLATYTAAYYLVHTEGSPEDEFLAYIEKHRSSFFESEYRIYQFASTLKGKWDMASLSYLAENIESYGSTTQSWILSSIEQQISLEFFPVIEKVRESTDPTTREWAARLLWFFANRISSMDEEAAARLHRDIVSIYESWNRNDSNKDVLYYLDRVENELKDTRAIEELYL